VNVGLFNTVLSGFREPAKTCFFQRWSFFTRFGLVNSIMR